MDKHLRFTIFSLCLLSSTAWSWNPVSEPSSTSPDCHPQVASWSLIDQTSPEKKVANLRSYLSKCWNQLQIHRPKGAEADRYLRDFEYPLPAATWLDWQDPQLDTRRIYRWQQSGKGKHPAVIVNCDFDCDLKTSVWIRRVILHLYENGPFDIYVVNSFQRKWWAGGLKDGQVLFGIAKWLVTESEDRGRIGSLQIFSEGTNSPGGLFALLYNDKNPIADDRKAIQGGVSLCPLVNPSKWLNHPGPLQATLESRFEFQKDNYDEWKYWLMNWRPGDNLSKVWWQASLDMSIKNLWLSPFRGSAPTSRDELEMQSNFSRHANGLSTPVWVIGSDEDPRFTFMDQLGDIIEQTKNPAKGRLRAFSVSDSTSCSWTSSIGWEAEGHIWRALLQSQSFEIWPREFTRTIVWPLDSPPLLNDELIWDQTWTMNENNQILLRYSIKGVVGMRIWDQLVSADLLPSELRPKNMNSEQDRMVWSRQANQRLRLALDGRPLLHMNQRANQLLWRAWRSVSN